MTAEAMRSVILSQFEASLCMLKECIEACPAEWWDGPAPTHTIAKYPFWMVAYHTLCFVDVYLSRTDQDWQPRTGPAGLHPRGRAELEDEYPSRKFSKEELLGYVEFCRRKLIATLGDEPGSQTAEILAGPSGFPRLPFSRAELHLYNIRHIQHHTGQLGAYLRRVDPACKEWTALRWAKAGWR